MASFRFRHFFINRSVAATITYRGALPSFRLGHDTIAVHVCQNLEDELAFLEAERDENTCRESLTPSEADEMQKRLLPKYEAIAKKEQADGQKRGGGDRRSAKAKKRSRIKKPRAKQDESKRTRARAAASTGYSASTLEQADG